MASLGVTEAEMTAWLAEVIRRKRKREGLPVDDPPLSYETYERLECLCKWEWELTKAAEDNAR